MTKKLRNLLLTIISIIAVIYTAVNDHLPSSTQSSTSVSQSSESMTTNNFDINSLNNTSVFVDHGLEHIFYGSINRQKQATGYHYEGISKEAHIIESTRSKKDRHGVYRAKIEIDHIEKKAYSSFFPNEWDPQKVVDAINEAYDNREHVTGNTYEGESDGITIQMYLSDQDQIISAFPVYER